MDPTHEASVVSTSTARCRRGKNPSNRNSNNKDNTNSNKGKEKEHESRVRDIDRETERRSGLNIDSHIGDNDDNDSEEEPSIIQIYVDFLSSRIYFAVPISLSLRLFPQSFNQGVRCFDLKVRDPRCNFTKVIRNHEKVKSYRQRISLVTSEEEVRMKEETMEKLKRVAKKLQ
ncbi:E3 ubiquitin-protein ligase [Forsythia ovata]|uniref:E3 ubiquitin-protein ligase n=1 Tax=Forsythia ovata TaxID=205694 RepID=A0ABD1WJI2_9LAMI